jgi:hypothetical protein
MNVSVVTSPVFLTGADNRDIPESIHGDAMVAKSYRNLQRA